MQIRVIFLISILLSSCSLSRRIESDNKEVRNQKPEEIMFMVFRISNDSVQKKNVIECVSKTQSSGRMKNEIQSLTDFEDYLTIEVFEQNKRTNIIIVEHPLYKHVEYVDDHEMLATKYVELKEAEFFVRFQMTGNPNRIRISENLKQISKSELITFKL